ncbi:hypothetical protein EV194_110116 [Natronoflexus pectinivorans]|uniref:Uncharacterized protein n=1 Tax=Natronoflexus pectinivorans TaxID=682526 RepID=A0A4R2GFV1_9BACT|nr:hypothetical protein EV194_110116 [Natronoflexus pectinivorans]
MRHKVWYDDVEMISQRKINTNQSQTFNIDHL